MKVESGDGFSGELTGGGCDVDGAVSGVSDDADDGNALCREDVRDGSSSDLRFVLCERDVAGPVDTFIDWPMSAHEPELVRSRLVGGRCDHDHGQRWQVKYSGRSRSIPSLASTAAFSGFRWFLSTPER